MLVLSDNFKEGVLSIAGNPPEGTLFYSTFFTSIWVWLYPISGLLVKLIERSNVGIICLKKILNIEKKHLRSIAIVSIGINTLIFIIVPFVN